MKLRNFLWCDESVVDDENGWYYCSAENAVVNLDLYHKVIKDIRPLDTGDTNKYRQYGRILGDGRYLYIFPDKAKDVLRYDRWSGDLVSISLGAVRAERINILGAFLAEENIYMISGGLSTVIKLNTVNFDVTCYESVAAAAGGELLALESVRAGNCIYIPLRNQPVILVFDIHTEGVDSYILEGIEGGFFTICREGEHFWLTGNCKKIISWNPCRGIDKVFDHYTEDFSIYDMNYTDHEFRWIPYPAEYGGAIAPFYQSILVKRKIWLIPRCANVILYIDLEQLDIGEFFIDGEDESSETLAGKEEKIKYIVQYIYGDIIGLYSVKNGCVYEINTSDLSYRRAEYSLAGNVIRYFFDTEKILLEDSRNRLFAWDLQAFIQMMGREVKPEAKACENIGRGIYDYIKSSTSV